MAAVAALQQAQDGVRHYLPAAVVHLHVVAVQVQPVVLVVEDLQRGAGLEAEDADRALCIMGIISLGCCNGMRGDRGDLHCARLHR